MEAVTELKQSSQSKNLNFFEFSRVSPGAHPLTKKPEDSGYEIGTTLNADTKGTDTSICIIEEGIA